MCIRDRSKSKGNVIDPLVLMDEFGADALRMALCSMAAQGRDIKLSKQRIEGYKNFINKIWNAVKLCELNNCFYQEIESKNTKNIFNKWILSEYENCRSKTQFAIEIIDLMRQQMNSINLLGIFFVTGI